MSIDGMGQTDGRTDPVRYIDPALHTMPVASIQNQSIVYYRLFLVRITDSVLELPAPFLLDISVSIVSFSVISTLLFVCFRAVDLAGSCLLN